MRSTRACDRPDAARRPVRLTTPRSPRHTAASSAPKWRNWQTRTFEGRVGQPVGVRVPPSAPVELIAPNPFPPIVLAAINRFTRRARTLLLIPLVAIASACASAPAAPGGSLAGIAERTWRGGGEVDLGATGTALGLVPQGTSYRTKQYEARLGAERRVIAVSRDRGPTDILFARSPADGDEVVIYLTGEDGVLVRAIHQKGTAAPTQVPNDSAARDFQGQKDFWLRRLGASAP